MIRRFPLAAALLVLLAGGALLFRLPSLGNRPFHGDESVHALKFRELWETGVYRYDANEFHGPTPYYAALPAVWLSGHHDFREMQEADLRRAIVFVGAAMVLLLLLLLDALGPGAALWAGLLTAISPALVFYSRYFIQETPLAFFTLALIGCGWRYARRRPSSEGEPRASTLSGWAAAAGLCAGLMVATKETAVITFAALGVALALSALWARRVDHGISRQAAPPRKHLLLALGVGLVTACLVLSGFLTNPVGPIDYLRSYTPWVGRAHGTDLHQHPWYYYLGLLAWTHRAKGPVFSEALILGLAAVGVIAAFVPRLAKAAGADAGFVRFAGFYTVTLTAAYTVIPYKTPWCVLSFLSGMVLLAGVGAMALLSLVPGRPLKLALGAALLVGCGQLAWQSYLASYVYYADNRNPYVYAQTVPELAELGKRVEALARAHPQGDQMVIKVFTEDAYHWPLPWTLRRFPNVGYWTSVPEDADAPVVIASPKFDEELTQRLDATHLMTGIYGLRPAVFLQLWVRMDLWERYLKLYPPKTDE